MASASHAIPSDVLSHSPKGLKQMRRVIVKDIVDTYEQHPEDLKDSYQTIIDRAEEVLHVSFQEDIVLRRESMIQIAFLYEQLGLFNEAKELFKDILSLFDFDNNPQGNPRKHEIKWHLSCMYYTEGRYQRAEENFRQLLEEHLPRATGHDNSSAHKRGKKGHHNTSPVVRNLAAIAEGKATIDILTIATELAISLTKLLYQISHEASPITSPTQEDYEQRSHESERLFEVILRHLDALLPMTANITVNEHMINKSNMYVQVRARRGFAELLLIVGRHEQALAICDEALSHLSQAHQQFPSRGHEAENWSLDYILSMRRARIEILLAMPNMISSQIEEIKVELQQIVFEQHGRMSLHSEADDVPSRLPHIERRINLLDSMFLLASKVYARPGAEEWITVELILRDVFDSRRRYLAESHSDVVEAKSLLSKARKQLSAAGQVPKKGSYLHIPTFRDGTSTITNEETTDSSESIFCSIFCF